MKIKQKKQLNLPQLIEYAWKNNVKDRFFPIDQNEESGIYFATNNDFMMNNADFIRYNNTFTVEIEEEITEDTEFNELVGLDVDGAYWQYDNVCVYDFNLDRIKAIYIPNDDLTLTLIWTREKGMVE